MEQRLIEPLLTALNQGDTDSTLVRRALKGGG
jgi:hypothetical protein